MFTVFDPFFITWHNLVTNFDTTKSYDFLWFVQKCTFLRMILKVFDSFDFSIFKLKTKFKTFLESSRIGGFANSPFVASGSTRSTFTSRPPFWIKFKRFSSESVYGTFLDILCHLVILVGHLGPLKGPSTFRMVKVPGYRSSSLISNWSSNLGSS